jgi:sirohydrochlorin ferrochelatase
MRIALVDNGSVEPAAHEGLRSAARAIGARANVRVEAVSWRHSDRIPASSLGDGAAQTLSPWIRACVSAGEREFLIVPFFISAQGAIGSALARDLDSLGFQTGGFSYSFTEGLSAGGVLPRILSERVKAVIAAQGLSRPAVVVADHGGPSRASAQIRDRVALEVRAELGSSVRALGAASMESPDGPEYGFNRPLLEEALALPGFESGDVVVAPLFLLPGRHAGKGGDLETIARVAEARSPGLRCHFADLVGSHPLALDTLAGALSRALGAAIRT